MQTGVFLSQTELGPDVSGLRDYAQAIQDLGYDFLVTADHVVGADPVDHPDLERVVTFDGIFDTVKAAGINPRPIQQPIPIWIGASAEAAVKRATRIADGFLPLRPLEGGWQVTVDKVHAWLDEAGRDPSTFGIEGRLDTAQGTPDDWRTVVEMWRGFGASHLSVGTSGAGNGPPAHIDRLRQVRQLLGARPAHSP